jgi:hypothetical protein
MARNRARDMDSLQITGFRLMALLFSKVVSLAEKPLTQPVLNGVTDIMFFGFGTTLATFESR